MWTGWTILAVSSVLLAGFAVVESGSDRHSTDSPRPPWDDTYACQTNICQNGGTCINFLGVITWCNCPETHVGIFCEIENGCYNDPCLNDGICDIDYHTEEQYCACREGWTGERCGTASTTTSCSYVSCEHGGTCYHYGGRFFCLCSSSYYSGVSCETEQAHPCDNPLTPCANGGSCIRDGQGHYCQCTSEWAGLNCTQPFPVAELCDDFCENGGSCYILPNYTPACYCQPGWRGEQCSEPTSFQSTTTTKSFPVAEPCDHFCENGGSCYIRRNYTPACYCQPGWRGEQCSEPTSFQSKTTTQASRPSPRNTDTPSSGLQVGAVVGLSVGLVVLLVVIFAGVCIVAMTKASKTRSVPHQHTSHGLTTAPPSVIYNPNAHGDFEGGVYTVPSAGVVLPQPTKDVYGSNRYQSNIPRRYTTGPVRQQSSGMMPNPGAGAYNYGYEHGPTQNSFIHVNAPAGHEHAYAEPAVPSVYTTPQPVPQQNGPPPPYTKAPSVAYSQAPSGAPSRVSEHTYQSLEEYAEPRSPSSKGGPTPSVK